MKREQSGSAMYQPYRSMRNELKMTPTEPSVSASTCRYTPAGASVTRATPAKIKRTLHVTAVVLRVTVRVAVAMIVTVTMVVTVTVTVVMFGTVVFAVRMAVTVAKGHNAKQIHEKTHHGHNHQPVGVDLGRLEQPADAVAAHRERDHHEKQAIDEARQCLYSVIPWRRGIR